MQLWGDRYKHRGHPPNPRDISDRSGHLQAVTQLQSPAGTHCRREEAAAWTEDIQCSRVDFETGFMFILESDTGDSLGWREAPESLLQGTVLPVAQGMRAMGEGQAPDHKQPAALSASELFKNKCNPVPTLKRKDFPSRSCCLGCLSFFIKTTSLSCFPLISMVSLMGNFSTGTMTNGCSWKINKELNLE